MRKVWSLVAFVLPFVLALPLAAQNPGSSAGGGRGASQNVHNSQPTAPSGDPSYIIGPADVLTVDVWKERELTRSVTVRSDGKISLPLLGDVQAAGETPDQLAKSLTFALGKYVTRPQVTVIVSAMNSHRVYVLGQVAHPGVLLLLGNLTVLQALATVGGPGEFAKLKDIYILRKEQGRQQRFRFNYKAVIRGKDTGQNIVLKPGDTIVVP